MSSSEKSQTMNDWAVVGFTLDQVVWWRAHENFAKQCAALWEAGGRPVEFQLLEKRGHDSNMLSWFVSPLAVQLLDTQGQEWREYVCGTTRTPPADSVTVPLS